jgi:excisionase family DNA binding protein
VKLAEQFDNRQAASNGGFIAARMTVAQAAERLGDVSPDTIYDLCKSGKLPSRRIGKGRGTIRIRATDLQQVGSPRVIKLREIA